MNVRRNSDGSDTEAVAEELRRLGYLGLADPPYYCDLLMEAYIRHFQYHAGLTNDGIVGPITYARLQATPVMNTDTADSLNIVCNTVNYETQRDNKNNPHGTCGPTSIGMLISSYADVPDSEAWQLEDQIYELLTSDEGMQRFKRHYSWAVGKYNPWNIHGMLSWAASEYGVPARFSELPEGNMRFERLFELLDKGPVVVSGRFTGSGHIVCVVGYTGIGDLIVHDPYGDWNSRYRDRDGEYRIYSQSSLRGVLKGWAHHIDYSI